MSIAPAGPRFPKAVPSPKAPNQAVRSGQANPPTGAKTFLQVLSEGQRQNPCPSAVSPGSVTSLARNPAKGPPPPVFPTGNPSWPGWGSMVERTLRTETRVDALVAAAAQGRAFSAGELIALQATVFRYSQTVEVISRAADRLVGSIKQTLSTQV